MFRPSLMFRPTWKAFVRRDYDFFVPHGRHDDHDVFRHDDGFRHLVLIPDFTQTSQDCTLSGSDPAGVGTQKHHLIWITYIFFQKGKNFSEGDQSESLSRSPTPWKDCAKDPAFHTFSCISLHGFQKIVGVYHTSRAGQAGCGSFKREKNYKAKKSKKHFAYRIVCDNLDWLNVFLMTLTKLASVGFVTARKCLQQQVLDNAKSLHSCSRSQSATTCDSS